MPAIYRWPRVLQLFRARQCRRPLVPRLGRDAEHLTERLAERLAEHGPDGGAASMLTTLTLGWRRQTDLADRGPAPAPAGHLGGAPRGASPSQPQGLGRHGDIHGTRAWERGDRRGLVWWKAPSPPTLPAGPCRPPTPWGPRASPRAPGPLPRRVLAPTCPPAPGTSRQLQAAPRLRAEKAVEGLFVASRWTERVASPGERRDPPRGPARGRGKGGGASVFRLLGCGVDGVAGGGGVWACLQEGRGEGDGTDSTSTDAGG